MRLAPGLATEQRAEAGAGRDELRSGSSAQASARGGYDSGKGHAHARTDRSADDGTFRVELVTLCSGRHLNSFPSIRSGHQSEEESSSQAIVSFLTLLHIHGHSLHTKAYAMNNRIYGGGKWLKS